MLSIRNLARNIFRNNRTQKNTTKRNRSRTAVLLAGVAVLAAVLFSVSVESRRWLWKTQPSTSSVMDSHAKVANNASSQPKTLAWVSVTGELFGCVFHNHLLDSTETEKRTAAEIAMPANKTGVNERLRLVVFFWVRVFPKILRARFLMLSIEISFCDGDPAFRDNLG